MTQFEPLFRSASELVTEAVYLPPDDWPRQVVELFARHRVSTTPSTLQYELVRQFLLNEPLVQDAIGEQDEWLAQRWSGDSLLVQVLDGPGTIAGLLLVDADISITSLDLTTEVRRSILRSIEPRQGSAAAGDPVSPDNYNALRDSLPDLAGPPLNQHLTESYYQLRERRTPDLFAAFLDALPLPVVLAPRPELELTAQTGDSIEGLGGELTIGAPVQMGGGTTGFLTACHGLRHPDNDTFGDARLPDGTSFPLRSKAMQWDGAFLESDEPPIARVPFTDVLRARAPGQGETGRFWGATSGDTQAAVFGVSPTLPNYHVDYLTGHFTTNPCLLPGDSGAYLVLDDGRIAGQAHARTKAGSLLQYSVWMWMAGVLDALGVSPLSGGAANPAVSAALPHP